MKQFRKNLAIAGLVLALGIPAMAVGSTSAKDLLAEGRVDEVISALQNKNDAESYNLRCRAHFAVGEWDRGIEACEKAVSLEPGNGRYHLWLGRIYGEKADRVNFLSAASLAGKVRTEFETAVKLAPDDVEARTDLAEFYVEAPGIVGGGKDKARAQAETLAKLDPAKHHWVNARIAEKNKDFAGAEREYKAAIEASHGSAESWLNLAFFYRYRNRLDEMEDAIQHASSAQTGHSPVLLEAAETLDRAGRGLPTAIKLVRQYLSSNVKVEEAPAFKAHYLLGTLLEKQGDKQGAAAEYRAALSIAKNYSVAQEALNRLNR